MLHVGYKYVGTEVRGGGCARFYWRELLFCFVCRRAVWDFAAQLLRQYPFLVEVLYVGAVGIYHYGNSLSTIQC